MDDELEHSPRSWLDEFMQWFSWCRLSARALPFLNNYFLLGVNHQVPIINIKFTLLVTIFNRNSAIVKSTGLDKHLLGA